MSDRRPLPAGAESVGPRRRLISAPALFLLVGLAVRLDASHAQSHEGLSINVASNGSCQAAGLDVSCREIGAKLREAGIPLDTWITFRGDATLGYGVMKLTIDSLAHAGFNNVKIGYATEPAR